MEPEEFHPDMECCVCGEELSSAKNSTHCESCMQPFHWSRCGGWERDAHKCDNCRNLHEND